MFWKIEYFIRDFWNEKKFDGKGLRVLDVGSRNINGSVKDAITNYAEFVGVDFVDGKDVDIVMDGHDLSKKWEKPYFDLVTCCETFEHDRAFWLTLKEMKKVLKPGGYLLITAPGMNFPQHDFPSDYYRFLPGAFTEVFFKGFEDVKVEEYKDPNGVVGLLGYGRKP